MSDPDRKRGLYQKYRVERLNDAEGKHDDCEYFVLDLHHDKFAIAALEAYAAACSRGYPKLSKELLLIATGMRADVAAGIIK